MVMYNIAMSYNKYYGGLIWTNHALERIGQRGMTQEIVTQTFYRPDHSFSGKEPGTIEYKKRFERSMVTLIAKQNDRREWLILSCWIDPPLAGTMDAKKREQYLKYKKSSFLGKLWLTLLKQLGIIHY